MEVLPPLFLLAAFGLSRISGKGIRVACIILAMVILGHLAFIDATYFPYSSGYFNLFAGNPNVRFDRDIEALSVHEAVAYVHAVYGRVRIWVPIGGHLSWYYLTSDDLYVYSAPDADTIVLVNKSSHFSQKDFAATIADTYHLVHTIFRGDAIFAWIYRKY